MPVCGMTFETRLELQGLEEKYHLKSCSYSDKAKSGVLVPPTIL